MVQKCRVLLNNRAVTVIRFGETEVQLPSISRDAEYVNVQYADGRYTVVPDDYKEEPIEEKQVPVKKKKAEKKTTKEEVETEAIEPLEENE